MEVMKCKAFYTYTYWGCISVLAVCARLCVCLCPCLECVVTVCHAGLRCSPWRRSTMRGLWLWRSRDPMPARRIASSGWAACCRSGPPFTTECCIHLSLVVPYYRQSLLSFTCHTDSDCVEYGCVSIVVFQGDLKQDTSDGVKHWVTLTGTDLMT